MAGSAVRVLVTGGAGFIGSHLTDLLLENGFEVQILDALLEQVHGRPEEALEDGWWPEWTEAQRGRGAVAHWADVRNPHALQGLLCSLRPHVVVHLAARVGVGQAEREIVRYVDSNVRGTAILLEQILEANQSAGPEDGVRRLLVAGSMSAYGEGQWYCPTHGLLRAERGPGQLADGIWVPLCPEAHRGGCPTATELQPVPVQEWNSLRPSGVYAATKRDQEELALLVARARGLSVAVPRFFNVVGPRQSLSNPYTGVAAIFAARCLSGHAPRVYEDGEQLRDFIHVSDVARALLALIGENNPRQAERTWANPDLQGSFNVCTGLASPISALAKLACQMLAPMHIPHVTGQYRVGDIRACVGSPKKLQEATGWSAQVTARDALVELYKSLAGQALGMTSEQLDAAHEQLAEAGLLYTPPGPAPSGIIRVPVEPTRWTG